MDRPPPFDEQYPAQGHDLPGDELVFHDRISEEIDPEAAPDRPGSGPNRLRVWRKPLLLLAPAALLVGGLYVFLTGGRHVTTDNAALQTGLVSIGSSVDGRVVAVEVHDNQRVKKGQVLFRIDPAPFEARVREAQAKLARARIDVQARRADYGNGLARLEATRAQADYADREAARQKALLAEGISSQDQYEQARLAARTSRESIESVTQENAAIAARLSGDVRAAADAQPDVEAAQAALDKARIDLGYTVVRAPQDGIVTKVDQLQAGDYVSSSRPVFSLSGARFWVEANFKEDQLQYMRSGQPATVSIDAYPDVELRARVTSFSPATGSSLSVLPAENATGNWVKVVQRLPVQIALEELPAGLPLHAGLSVEVSVDTGHKRRAFGSDRSNAQPTAAPVQ